MTWQTVKYRWKWQLNRSPTEVWSLVNDTHNLSTLASLPTTEIGTAPSDFAQKLLFSGGDPEDNKESCHWVRYARISGNYERPGAAVSQVSTELAFEKNKKGTLVKMVLAVTPNTFIGMLVTPWLIGRQAKKALQQFFQSLNAKETIGATSARESLLSEKQTSALAIGAETLAQEDHAQEHIDALCQILTYDPASALVNMRPFLFADEHLFPRKKILELFVAANEAGILTSDWLVSCTECGQWKTRCKRLKDIDLKMSCPHCNERVNIRLDKNIELIFFPHPLIRKTPKEGIDPYNPKANPNILIRQTLAPGTVMTLKVRLVLGHYSVHTENAQSENWARFTIDAKGAGEVTCEAVNKGMEISQKPNKSESKLVLANRTATPQLFVVQEDSWLQQRCSAMEANCCQRYRQSFANEAPSTGTPVSVDNICVLVSDVVASTAMCTSLGDIEGYSVIRDIYDFQERIINRCGGAIFKIHGDTILAGFPNQQDAMSAALAVQGDFDSYNATHQVKEQTNLKQSLHNGDCIAVNLGDRLDLFGSTISIAEHLLNLCNKGELIASEQVMTADGVQSLFQSNKRTIEPFEHHIEGLDTAITAMRITLSSLKRTESTADTTTATSSSDEAETVPNSTTIEDKDSPFASLRFDSEASDEDSNDTSGVNNIYL
ncbi:hypothetical protein SCG7086_AO_00160 [Chlamydiales bacterium SCGC AG-110-P3]|nr:hypothetical protein SCG7086_AO_00160 [Chlamydiales bacterium SCGC AG-110-P3]